MKTMLILSVVALCATIAESALPEAKVGNSFESFLTIGAPGKEKRQSDKWYNRGQAGGRRSPSTWNNPGRTRELKGRIPWGNQGLASERNAPTRWWNRDKYSGRRGLTPKYTAGQSNGRKISTSSYGRSGLGGRSRSNQFNPGALAGRHRLSGLLNPHGQLGGLSKPTKNKYNLRPVTGLETPYWWNRGRESGRRSSASSKAPIRGRDRGRGTGRSNTNWSTFGK